MRWLTSLCVATVLSHCGYVMGAQLPSELSKYYHTSKNVIASFDNGVNVVTQPGQLLPLNETQQGPDVYIPGPEDKSSAAFLLLMVDPSFNATVPTNTVLHTIAGNLTTGQIYNNATWNNNASTVSLTMPTPVAAPYVGPEPQPNTPTHNYTIMIFRQPSNFAIPSKYAQWMPLNESNPYTRTNFPVVQFTKDTGLGQPMAATYFRLDLSNANSAGSPTPASSAQAVTTTSVSGTTTTDALTGRTLLGALLPTSVYFLI